MEIDIKIMDTRLGNEIPMPSYATDGSAGMDLRACIQEPLTLHPGEVQLVPTGIAAYLNDPGYAILLLPRSGLAAKHKIVVINSPGLIDSDFQGQMQVALFNKGNKPYTVEIGERICQMVVVPVIQVRFRVVEEFKASQRGAGGFGHSGRL